MCVCMCERVVNMCMDESTRAPTCTYDDLAIRLLILNKVLNSFLFLFSFSPTLSVSLTLVYLISFSFLYNPRAANVLFSTSTTTISFECAVSSFVLSAFFSFYIRLPKIIYHINSLTLRILTSDKITLHTIFVQPSLYISLSRSRILFLS